MPVQTDHVLLSFTSTPNISIISSAMCCIIILPDSTDQSSTTDHANYMYMETGYTFIMIINTFFSFLQPIVRFHLKFGKNGPRGFKGGVIWKHWLTAMMTDELIYPVTSPGAFGLGKLKSKDGSTNCVMQGLLGSTSQLGYIHLIMNYDSFPKTIRQGRRKSQAWQFNM